MYSMLINKKYAVKIDSKTSNLKKGNFKNFKLDIFEIKH